MKSLVLYIGINYWLTNGGELEASREDEDSDCVDIASDSTLNASSSFTIPPSSPSPTAVVADENAESAVEALLFRLLS